MIPLLTPAEMAEVDAAAPEPLEVLVSRAAWHVAAAARRVMGGCTGRTVLVVAGRGNNGADGRRAATLLERRGARVKILEAGSLPPGEPLGPADLVIDAAYGTGLSRPYPPPDPAAVPVLAVDIPSGLSGVTGLPPEGGSAMNAVHTVTFQALKPGLLLGEGPSRAGSVEVADIGLGPLAEGVARSWVLTDSDVVEWLPARSRHAHKWQAAVGIVAGGASMPGAALLVAEGALRAGSGYALVAVPGGPIGGGLPPGPHVASGVALDTWPADAAALLGRAKSLVVGPGLGSSALGSQTPGTGRQTSGGAPSATERFLAETSAPAVVDADALGALGGVDALARVVASRSAAVVVTPHDGEWARLVGTAPSLDRLGDARALSAAPRAVVVMKGYPTLVADPEGTVLVAASGPPSLATAGSGDVLAGMIGAFLASGMPAARAAAAAAHIHGRAAASGAKIGLVSSDLPVLVSRWMSQATESGSGHSPGAGSGPSAAAGSGRWLQ